METAQPELLRIGRTWKLTCMPALMGSSMKLETKCAMLKQQIKKLGGALEEADADKMAFAGVGGGWGSPTVGRRTACPCTAKRGPPLA